MRIAFGAGALGLVAAVAALGLVLARAPSTPPNVLVATGQEEAFSRHFVAGCALGGREVYLAGRGALARYDGEQWSLASLSPSFDVHAIACRDGTVVAVGSAGWLASIDVNEDGLKLEHVADVDLRAVALLDDGGVLAAGDEETIVAGRTGAWQRLWSVPGGRPWLSMHALSRHEVWLGTRDATVVLYDGQSFEERLIPEMCFDGKSRCGGDVTAIAPYGARMAVAARRIYSFPPPGTVPLRVDAGWTRRSDGGTGPLELIWKTGREVASLFSPDGQRIYIVTEDDVTLVRGVAPIHSAETQPPYGLSCPLRAIFGPSGGDVWLLGSGVRSGLARFDGSVWLMIQQC